jgi:hypothetical protein
VPCEQAVAGDPCATAGEWCDIACTNCVLQCGDDLHWKEECFGCPELAPAPGGACDPCVNVGACNYGIDTTCGMLAVTATCDATSQTWQFEGDTCPADCFAIADEAACGGTSGCRWLTPGCSGTPLPAAGCFPEADCAMDEDCPAERTCQTANYNPCYMQACDACGADAQVCLP